MREVLFHGLEIAMMDVSDRSMTLLHVLRHVSAIPRMQPGVTMLPAESCQPESI